MLIAYKSDVLEIESHHSTYRGPTGHVNTFIPSPEVQRGGSSPPTGLHGLTPFHPFTGSDPTGRVGEKGSGGVHAGDGEERGDMWNPWRRLQDIICTKKTGSRSADAWISPWKGHHSQL